MPPTNWGRSALPYIGTLRQPLAHHAEHSCAPKQARPRKTSPGPDVTHYTPFRRAAKLPALLFAALLGGLLRGLLRRFFLRFGFSCRFLGRGFFRRLLGFLRCRFGRRSSRHTRRRRCRHPWRGLGRVLDGGLHPHWYFLGLLLGNAQFLFFFRIADLIGLDPQLFLLQRRQFVFLETIFFEIHDILPWGKLKCSANRDLLRRTEFHALARLEKAFRVVIALPLHCQALRARLTKTTLGRNSRMSGEGQALARGMTASRSSNMWRFAAQAKTPQLWFPDGAPACAAAVPAR